MTAPSERRDPEGSLPCAMPPLSPFESRRADVADPAPMENPDGSTILSRQRGAEKIAAAGQGHGHASCQRRGARIGRRAVDHAARRAAARSRPDRDQKGLRSRPMRRLHRSGRWSADRVVPYARDHEGRRAGHDDRGSGARKHASSVATAFIEHDALQCGYCTPGQICSAVGLIAEGRARTADEIRELMSGNICRCGAYPNILAAIQQAMTVMGDKS
jgi:[2Fe-2S] binding domain